MTQLSGTSRAADARTHLSPAKQALMARLLGETGGDGAPRAATAARRTETVPLSFAQQRLWFLDQMVPGSPVYNVIMSVRLSGPIDPGLVRRSVAEIVRRHESLRTTFPALDGDPWQAVTDEVEIPVDVVDLSGAEPTREDRLAEHVAAAAREPFDLATGPLLRVTQLRLADDLHVVLLVTHHIVVDGWSLGLFWQELLTLYDAYADGRESPLPPVPLQYPDYTLWQHEYLGGGKLERQLDYWREHLAGRPESTELPLDAVRPPVQSFEGGDLRRHFSGELREALARLGREEGVSLFVIVLAALNGVLARWTGRPDVIVGSPVINRPRVDLESMIGMVVNTVVYRTTLPNNPTFHELVRRTLDTVNGANRHQDLPFEVLVDDLQPERHLNQNPLFGVCFNFLPARPLESGKHLRVEQITGERNGTAKFDLWISIVDRRDALLVEVEYSSDIFTAATVERIVDSLHSVLEGVVSDAGLRLSELPVLPEGERARVLTEWNDTAVEYPDGDRTLTELLVTAAEHTPGATALVSADRSLTYRELHEQAGVLAALLRAHGAGPGTRVAVCAQRSPELVVALLATQLAGACYVPVDPSYPQERREFMLADADAPIVLTQSWLRPELPAVDALVIDLDVPLPDVGGVAPESRGATPDDIAYMIYTSGSTGRPKGVPNRHRGIVNRLLWMREALDVGPQDRILQKTPFSFDVSVWEFFLPLLAGATLVVAPPDAHKDPAALADLVERERITTMHFVPSMLQVFLGEPGLRPRCGSLLRVVCSGEALPFALQERFFAELPDVELHNLYGPTEAAVDVTWWRCVPHDPSGVVPIGLPIANTRTYVLDADRSPVPVGVVGELYLGGVQVAAGYHNRPELTAERFVEDPYGGVGDRLYRTGDLVRHRPDGVLLYLGRADDQVKIRGVRVEPGEIETAIRRHEAVLEASVVAVDDTSAGGQRLVAYVVPERGARGDGGSGAGSGEEGGRQPADWAEVFDESYGDGGDVAEAAFNVLSWNSSYTGEPLPEQDMREWVDSTVERIRALRPRRVLEIGCGTGLLLARLAPDCEAYCGTEISTAALDFVRERLIAERADLRHVELRAQPADDVSGLGDPPYDVVVLNSVVQYFPGEGYLRTVLDRLLDLLTPDGVVFVGDVRHAGLLEALHTDVEISAAASSTDAARLRGRVRRRVRQEQELVVAPDWFRDFAADERRLARADTLLRRGRAANELTRFRYDVVLRRVGGSAAGRVHAVDASADLPALLGEQAADAVVVTQLPNARLTEVNARCAGLAGKERDEVVGELTRRGVAVAGHADPEDLVELGERAGWSVRVEWSPGRSDGAFDAIFTRTPDTAVPLPDGDGPAGPLVNDPTFNRLAAALPPVLRKQLRSALPDYMMPAAFVAVPAFPVTPNGKLDRAALPPPEFDVDADDGTAPQTPTEHVLADVWCEVLGLDRVGIGTNFFEVGGDSIHCIHVASRARQAGLTLSPQLIFRHGTIAALAQAVDEAGHAVGPEAHPAAPAATTTTASAAADPAPDVEATYPLGPFQRWALARWRREPVDGLFLVHRFETLPLAAVDPERFTAALGRLIDTHPLLRTSFAWRDRSEPLQIVHRDVAPECVFADWRELDTAEQEAEVELYLAADRRRGIDPEQPSALRYLIAQLDGATALVVVSMNYLCLDGWSFDIVTGELLRVLTATGEGRPVPELPARVPFAEYVAATRPGHDPGAPPYWQKALAGWTEPFAVPAGILGGADGGGGDQAARVLYHLDRPVSAAVRAAARTHHVPLNSLIQLAWALTLGGWAGRTEVMHGVLLTGRSAVVARDARLGEVVGPAFTILPLATELAPDHTADQAVRAMHEALTEMSEHETTGLDEVLALVDLPVDREPCDSYVVFQNVGVDSMEQAGDAFFVSKMGLPLRVDVFPTSRIALHLSYHLDHCSHVAAAGLMNGFVAVLEALAAELRRPLQELTRIAALPHRTPDAVHPIEEGALRMSDIRSAGDAGRGGRTG